MARVSMVLLSIVVFLGTILPVQSTAASLGLVEPYDATSSREGTRVAVRLSLNGLSNLNVNLGLYTLSITEEVAWRDADAHFANATDSSYRVFTPDSKYQEKLWIPDISYINAASFSVLERTLEAAVDPDSFQSDFYFDSLTAVSRESVDTSEAVLLTARSDAELAARTSVAHVSPIRRGSLGHRNARTVALANAARRQASRHAGVQVARQGGNATSSGPLYMLQTRKLSVAATCALCFERWPFDKHDCYLSFVPLNDWVMQAAVLRETDPDLLDKLSSFKTDIKFSRALLTKPQSPNEPQSGAYITVELVRPGAIFVVVLILPLIVVVMIAFVGLFISHSAPPARFGIGGAATLSTIALLFTVSNRIPLNPFLTVGEVFFFIALLFVGAVLIESGATHHMNNKAAHHAKCARKHLDADAAAIARRKDEEQKRSQPTNDRDNITALLFPPGRSGTGRPVSPGAISLGPAAGVSPSVLPMPLSPMALSSIASPVMGPYSSSHAAVPLGTMPHGAHAHHGPTANAIMASSVFPQGKRKDGALAAAGNPPPDVVACPAVTDGVQYPPAKSGLYNPWSPVVRRRLRHDPKHFLWCCCVLPHNASERADNWARILLPTLFVVVTALYFAIAIPTIDCEADPAGFVGDQARASVVWDGGA
eukprot:TRINITY_DN1781_c0_g2_i1.p1 TRINITY_DN1781_c0_g2~~TRINITY_DN1781_c0_g2_i1.p1  ORF type:complete len:654 (-),score=131.33 TRINITY_DN1781_c0_g2_i1:471-2432(-)